MKIPAAKAAVDKEWEKLEKISAWNLTKVRSKKEVIDDARMSGATVHFASLMDMCHLKNAELDAKHQKYKGRVVLRGDIVKDDSGSYAVFTEQGSSASQMTAAKIMDIISRLPGCYGQAADAVSAYIQVKMEDAHKLLKIPKSECPDIWIRLPRHKCERGGTTRTDQREQKIRPIALLETPLKLIQSVAVDQHADHIIALMQEQQVGFRVRGRSGSDDQCSQQIPEQRHKQNPDAG